MSAPVVQLFVNRRPGWLARRRVRALRRAFGKAGATVLLNESVADRLEIDPRADRICTVGGDGTMRHVMEAVHRSGRTIPISVYPAGTVNLIARECRYPRDPHAFVRRVLGGEARMAHHTALIGGSTTGIPLLACASIGPDSYVVEALSLGLKARIGRAAYLVAFAGLLFRWRRAALTLEWEGGQVACEAVYIAKGRYFGGPWTFAPAARMTDPLLHVVALRRASRSDFVRLAWTMLRGRPVDALPGVRSFTCTGLNIMGGPGAPGMPLQADGDIVAHCPVSLAMRPSSTPFS